MRRKGGAIAALALAWACAALDIAGVYEANLPAASGGGERNVSVTLETDGTAVVSSAFPGRPSRFLVEGKWRLEKHRVIVDLGKGQSMVFDYADDSLIARHWDRSVWGEEGPGTLRRVLPGGQGLRG